METMEQKGREKMDLGNYGQLPDASKGLSLIPFVGSGHTLT